MKNKKFAREADSTIGITEKSGPDLVAKVTPFKQIIEKEWVEILLPVPHDAVSYLPGRGDVKRIRPAEINRDKDIQLRVEQWSEIHEVGCGFFVPPTSYHLEQMLRRSLDSTIQVYLEAEDWGRVVKLADILGITAEKWLLACVGYAVYRGVKEGEVAA